MNVHLCVHIHSVQLVWAVADVWGEFSCVSILSGLPSTFEGREGTLLWDLEGGLGLGRGFVVISVTPARV